MKKTQPTPRRNQAVAKHRRLGDRLRAWLHERELDALTRREKERAGRPAGGRGADRLPAQMRVERPEPEWVHQHTGHPYTPYVSPARDAKSRRAGRLRKELL